MTSGGMAQFLELWGVRSTLSLPLLPSPLSPEVVRVPSMGLIDICILLQYVIQYNYAKKIKKLHRKCVP